MKWDIARQRQTRTTGRRTATLRVRLMVGAAFDFISLFPGKPGATKSNRIQPKNIVALGRNYEGRNIFAEGGTALRDHQSADAHILMENAAATEKGVVADRHITAQQHVVRDDHLVADNAVVSDMRVGHEKIFIPDLGRAVCRCATMNSALLANDVAFADFHSTSRSRRKTNVL